MTAPLTSPLGGDDLAKALRDAYGRGWSDCAADSEKPKGLTGYRDGRDAWIAQYMARLPTAEPIAVASSPCVESSDWPSTFAYLRKVAAGNRLTMPLLPHEAQEILRHLASAPSPEAGAGGDLGAWIKDRLACAQDYIDLCADNGTDNPYQKGRISLLRELQVQLVARSGKLAVSTDRGGEQSGASPSGSGSHPSDRTASRSAGFAVSILRAELMAKAEEQIRYWHERQSREKSYEDCLDEEGIYTPMGDDAAMRFGSCNGRYSEADWWLKTIDAITVAHLKALGTEARSAETFGLGPKDDGPACKATPEATPKSSPDQTPVDPQMTVEEARWIVTSFDNPARWANFYRTMEQLSKGARDKAIWSGHASRIELALRTLQAGGEVR